MKFSYSLKYNINVQYEMHEVTFEADTKDLPSSMEGCSLTEAYLYFQLIALHQGVISKIATGYFTREQGILEMQKIKQEIKKFVS